MVEMTASIDGAASAALNAALGQLSGALGEYATTAPKVAALAICDSLRKETKKAPKRARPREYRAVVSANPPKYITYKNGKKLAKPLHRWTLTRKLGTPSEYTRDIYVYAGSRAEELRDLRLNHLKIAHAGAAKASWRKAKDEIKKGSSDIVWQKRKRDRRNPMDSVHGKFSKSTNTTTASGTAEIHNHLDYIAMAVNGGAVDRATAKAAAKLVFNKAFRDLKAGGMDAKRAAEIARNTVHTFKAEFGI